MIDPPESAEILLIYDKECPACRNYARMVRIRSRLGRLQTIDAREDSAAKEWVNERGLDLDQGMVVVIGDNFYHGADAMHVLALMSSRSDTWNRINYRTFRSRRRSRWLYPILRSLRNTLLRVLRVRKINNLGIAGNDRF
ncbi:MAG: DUF393 domain-containing protein [Chromatiaceae bacterium]|nr:DUF393 domain-containing protein [Gammaproteobacteria bacterium]MCP5305729.1 DUF393 domain-containing protein [Chromatiaceae bacterium]MCP5312586.1 DUF393 domain-containing protein [Chromatiaceae bacterium]